MSSFTSEDVSASALSYDGQGRSEIHKRALRRYHAQRRKAWVRRALRHYFMERHALPARRVGMDSKTPKICSCFMCGNPRRFCGELTIQERRAMLDSNLLESWTEGNPCNHEIDFGRRAEARGERL
jgi:hypothetical protein